MEQLPDLVRDNTVRPINVQNSEQGSNAANAATSRAEPLLAFSVLSSIPPSFIRRNSQSIHLVGSPSSAPDSSDQKNSVVAGEKADVNTTKDAAKESVQEEDDESDEEKTGGKHKVVEVSPCARYHKRRERVSLYFSLFSSVRQC